MPPFATFVVVAAFWSFLHGKYPQVAAERSVVQDAPVRMTVHLPEGWIVTDGQVVPPAELRGSCQVRASLYPDSDWKSAMESLVRDTDPNSRVLSKRGGHVAVEYRSHSASSSKDLIFIDLEDMRPRTFVVWNVENDNSDAGQQCHMAFDEMIGTVEFEAVTLSQ